MSFLLRSVLLLSLLLPFVAKGADVNRFVTPFIENQFDPLAFTAADARRILGIQSGGGTNILTTTNTVFLTVDNVADLRNISTVGPSAGVGAVYLSGYAVPGDGGASLLRFYPAPVAVAIDDFIYFLANDGGGVWKREITLPFTGFPVPWAGGMVPGTESDGIVNRAALEKVRDFCASIGGGAVIAPHGSWTIDNSGGAITWTNNVILLGDAGATIVASSDTQPIFGVSAVNNAGFFNVGLAETTDPAILMAQCTNFVISGCSFTDDTVGVRLSTFSGGSTNIALLFNTFSNVGTQYDSFPTFNDGNGFVRIDYETALGGSAVWTMDGETATLTSSATGALIETDGNEFTWDQRNMDGSDYTSQFRVVTDFQEIDFNFASFNGSGDETGIYFTAQGDTLARLHLVVAGNVVTRLNPTREDGSTPYVFDTTVTHTSGEVMDWLNLGDSYLSFSPASGGHLGAQANLAQSSFALGNAVTATGFQSIGIGTLAAADIDFAMNFSSPSFVSNDDGRKTGDPTVLFNPYTAAETVFVSTVLDLKTTAGYTNGMPNGTHFFPTEVGVIVTSADTVTVQPTIEFGIPGSLAFYKAAAITTTVDTAFGRQGYTTLATQAGSDVVTATVTIAATATTLDGRFYWKGFLVHDE